MGPRFTVYESNRLPACRTPSASETPIPYEDMRAIIPDASWVQGKGKPKKKRKRQSRSKVNDFPRSAFLLALTTMELFIARRGSFCLDTLSRHPEAYETSLKKEKKKKSTCLENRACRSSRSSMCLRSKSAGRGKAGLRTEVGIHVEWRRRRGGEHEVRKSKSRCRFMFQKLDTCRTRVAFATIESLAWRRGSLSSPGRAVDMANAIGSRQIKVRIPITPALLVASIPIFQARRSFRTSSLEIRSGGLFTTQWLTPGNTRNSSPAAELQWTSWSRLCLTS